MKYKGSCHCGAVAFEASGEIDQLLACNCSICQRKGSLLWFVPKAEFTLLTPESALSVYTFNKHAIQHKFCTTCGIHTFGQGSDGQGNEMVAINTRCLEDIRLEEFPVQHFDGRAL